MAQMVLRVAGAAVGGAFGGPAGAQLGWALGGVVAGVVAPEASGSPQKSEGPRLRDLSSGTSSYGAVIPYLIGHPRSAGNVVWSSNKKETAHTSTSGGGGGKGGGAPPAPAQTVTSYTYAIDVLYLLDCRISSSLRKVWSNNKVVSTFGGPGPWTRMTMYNGDPSQMPDPVYEAAVGIANAVAYRGRTTVFIENLDLGESGSIPNLQFEISHYASN